MNFLSLNIKWLKDKEALSEVDFGKLFGLNRGAIGSYIHEGVNPKLETLQKISEKYNLTLDDLVNTDIGIMKQKSLKQYPNEEAVNTSGETVTLYTCPECVNKQNDIDYWKSKYYSLCDDSREVERKYRELLESKIEIKKETSDESITPAV